MPASPLTRSARVTQEQGRISRLTNEHEAHFKVILSHQVENRYNFASIHNRDGKTVSIGDKAKILSSFGRFLDATTKLTISEVESKYERPPDSRDGTYDPESDSEVEIQHFCLFDSDASRDSLRDSVRIHGYFRTNGGYFVVTRLDWFHAYHSA